ncbi:hypothetical protein QQ045_009470 [Rhodiola kirilowii]
MCDIEATGCHYTWSNNNINPEERIWCKLDRAMGNSEWFNQLPECSVTILAHVEDCSPIRPEVVNRGKKVEEEQCRALIREANDKEICNALSRIGLDKSPGPDGFSASFFRKNWSVLGKEFCSAIRHCLRHNALPRGSNAALIILIPKSNLAAAPEDNRHISRCNVTYKVISGILRRDSKVWFPSLLTWRNERGSAILAIKGVLEEFIRCSRLSVNIDKSQLFTAGMDESKRLWIENLLCTKMSALPVRYLGVPLTSKSISAHDCSPIIQRLTMKLDCWNNRLLSRAGRRVLIQSVLQSIVFYWARIYFLPKKVLMVLNYICANFLWNGSRAGRSCHLQSWKMACIDKKEGGLGIKDMEMMNDAMVLNQLWDLSREEQNLWTKWIHAYWTKGNHWWENEALYKSSWVIRRLMACKHLSLKCVVPEDGRLRWIGKGEGFTVRDTFITLKDRVNKVDWYKLAWNRSNTPRATFTAVIIAHDRLLTKAILRSMGINVPLCCVLCNEADETRDHLFFCCRISRVICGKVLDFLKVGRVPTRWHLLIPWFKSINQCRLKIKMIAAAVTSTMVALWKARNSIIFRSERLI